MITIGRGEYFNPDVTDRHIDIGEQPLPPETGSAIRRFNHLSFDAFGRMLAYKVMFNEMYRRATNVKVLGKKFHLWNRAWTYPSISVHTTRSPSDGGDNRPLQPEVAEEDDTGLVAEVVRGGGPDSAQLSGRARPGRNGGIDMDNRWLRMDVDKSKGRSVEFDDKAMEAIPLEGVEPRVRSMVPVTPGMLKLLLGEAPKTGDVHDA